MQPTKQRFMKLYADIPLGLRRDIVAVLDEDGPVTWNTAYVEIENDTDKGRAILTKLEQMEII
jgi:hypothetical protein